MLNFIIIDVFNFHKYSKYQNELRKSPNLIGQKTEEIIPIGINNQSQQQKNPTIWAYSINLSLGFLPLTISYNKNITCPPSKAGIGNRFIKAKMIEIKAVLAQKPSNPSWPEKDSDGTKTSQLRSSFFGKDIFELGYIVIKRPISITETFRDAFGQ